jgi:Fic family protein
VYVAAPPSSDELLAGLVSDPDRFVEVMTAELATDGGYVHWDEIKWGRQRALRPLPLADPSGRPFAYSQPDAVLRSLRHVDKRCSGELAMSEVVTADDQARQYYLVNSLMEEAIRSSQLEGASTSRSVAKELLRSGREPTDRSERMILNNYRALQYMRGVGASLDPETIVELNRIVTDGTLDDPSAAGGQETPEDDGVVVYDRQTHRLRHMPPAASQLSARLEALCGFANQHEDSEPFIHPVVRAILLHFWLAYVHPFEDGNGRTARALFSWSMRTRGYWLVDYLTVSRILAEAPAKYSRAFLETETDAGDTTYFVLYQLHVIERAIAELHTYLGQKAEEIREVERLMRDGSAEFSHRQLALLSHATRHPDQIYTLRTHSASHGVTHETARNDLLPLVEKGLLMRHRAGRQHTFTSGPRLADRLTKGH